MGGGSALVFLGETACLLGPNVCSWAIRLIDHNRLAPCCRPCYGYFMNHTSAAKTIQFINRTIVRIEDALAASALDRAADLIDAAYDAAAGLSDFTAELILVDIDILSDRFTKDMADAKALRASEGSMSTV